MVPLNSLLMRPSMLFSERSARKRNTIRQTRDTTFHGLKGLTQHEHEGNIIVDEVHAGGITVIVCERLDLHREVREVVTRRPGSNSLAPALPRLYTGTESENIRVSAS